MTAFNLTKEQDEFFTIQFLIIFLIGFCINVYSNGQATLIFMHNEYDISPDSPIYNLTPEYQALQKYTNQEKFRNVWAEYIMLFLYFIVSPLVNLYYGFFVFKKRQTQQSLNIEIT
jgi:hypothetical protein